MMKGAHPTCTIQGFHRRLLPVERVRSYRPDDLTMSGPRILHRGTISTLPFDLTLSRFAGGGIFSVALFPKVTLGPIQHRTATLCGAWTFLPEKYRTTVLIT